MSHRRGYVVKGFSKPHVHGLIRSLATTPGGRGVGDMSYRGGGYVVKRFSEPCTPYVG